MTLKVDFDREEDGRWIAAVEPIPGCHVYGKTPLPERFKATKAKRVFSALPRIGWTVKKTSGSHKTLSREGWPNVIFAQHDREELGPQILSKIAKEAGLNPEDL